MQILGIRNAPKEIRYAVVDWDGSNATLVNANDETRLKFPPAITDPAEKLCWAKSELERVLRNYPNVTKVVIKSNEYTNRGGETGKSRQAAYLDAVAQVVAAENQKPVKVKIYASLASRKAQAKEHAETRVGATPMYWNDHMADAILAAYSGRE